MRKSIFILSMCISHFVSAQTILTHDDSVVVAKYVYQSSFDSQLFPCMIQTGHSNIVAIRKCVANREKIITQLQEFDSYMDSLIKIPNKGYRTLHYLEELKQERKILAQAFVFSTAQIVQLCMCPKKNKSVVPTDAYGD